MMQTREHIVHYMLSGHVHLSKKDYGFFHNIQKLIHENNQITSNQNKLFEKLLLKYSRQLNRLGYNNKNLLSIQWKCNIIESSPLYTDASVDLFNGQIVFSCPFNSNFLKTLKTADYNPFIWDKQTKKYYAPFTTYALRLLTIILSENFKNVRYSDSVQEIINSTSEYIGYTFNPTLKNINGVLYVVACNETLNDHIKNIKLERTGKCYYYLTSLGIMIDESLIGDDPFLKFASSYYAEVDLNNIDDLVSWLHHMGVTHTLLFETSNPSKNSKDNDYLKDMLTAHGLKYQITNSRLSFGKEDFQDSISKYVFEHNPVLIRQSSLYHIKNKMHKFSKCVTIKNSRSISL